MAVAETDINESLKTLAQDAENARLYGSPPDAIVMRAIELGMGTRADIRRATGYGYDVIEKCLERNSMDLRTHFEGEIEHFRFANVPEIVKGVCIDCGGPRSGRSFERCQKCHTTKIHDEQAASVATRIEAQKKIDEMIERGKEPPETTSNGDSVIHESENRNFEVFDSQKETAMKRVSKFGISVNAEVRGIVEAMEVGQETDTPRLLAELVKAHPALRDNPEQTTLKTYIAQGVSPLKGTLLRVVSKGKGGSPSTLCRIPETAVTKISARNGQDAVKKETKVRTEIAQPIVAETVEPDKKQDKIKAAAMPMRFGDFCERNCYPPTVGHHMNCGYYKQTVVEGVLRFGISINLRVADMARWQTYDIADFFKAIATLQKLGARS